MCALLQTYVIGYPIYSIYAAANHEKVIFIVIHMQSDKRTGRFDSRAPLDSFSKVSRVWCSLWCETVTPLSEGSKQHLEFNRRFVNEVGFLFRVTDRGELLYPG